MSEPETEVTETPAPRRRAAKVKTDGPKARAKAAKTKPGEAKPATVRPARRKPAEPASGPSATVKRAATATRRVAHKATDEVRAVVDRTPTITGKGIAVGAAVVAVGAIAGAAAALGRDRLTKAKDDLVDAVKTTGKKVAAAVPTRVEADRTVPDATTAD